MACAAAVASLTIFDDDDIVGRARRLGEEILRPRLAEMAERHPSVGEVRGMGCFWALELVKDPTTREMFVPFNASGPDAAPMGELMAACRAGGVVPFAHFNRLHLAPPLVISEADLHHGLDRVDEALSVADRHVGT